MSHKVVIVGTSGVGKSTYLNKLTTDNPADRNKTVIQSLCFETNRESQKVTFHVWDIHGRVNLESNLGDASGAIVIYDVTSEDPSSEVNGWITEIRKTSQVPIVICGNLVDSSEIQFSDKIENCHHFLMATEIGLNLNAPFNWIARQITKDSELKLTSISGFCRSSIDLKENKLEETSDRLLDAIHDYIDARPPGLDSSMEIIRMVLEISGK